MSNPKCSVCGQINRVGAEVCELCDSRLGDADGAAHGVGASVPEDFYAGGEQRREGALPTDIPSPQFKGVGDVVSPTLDVYKKNFALVGLLVLATTLPLAALQYASYFFVASGASESERVTISTDASAFPVMAAGMWGGAALSWLLALLGNSMLAGALAYAVVELQRTGTAKASDCLRWGLGKMPKIALVNLLFSIMIYGGGAFLFGISFFVLGPVAVFVLLLLLVPWIVLSLMFALIVPAVAVENRGVIEAFTRSAELTRGQKGLLFLTYFLWGLLIFVVQMIVGGSFAIGGAQESAAVLLLQTFVGQMLQSTTIVLTLYIFLGILNETRRGFDNRAVTPAPEAAR